MKFYFIGSIAVAALFTIFSRKNLEGNYLELKLYYDYLDKCNLDPTAPPQENENDYVS